MAHVFIVDDDPGIRAVLRSALEAEDHAVIEAAERSYGERLVRRGPIEQRSSGSLGIGVSALSCEVAPAPGAAWPQGVVALL